MNEHGLSPKQNTFVNEYLIDMNGTRAYIAAGYSPNGASPSAFALLRTSKVKAAVNMEMQKRAEEANITAEQVLFDLREVANVALGRMPTTTTKEWIDEDGEECKTEVTTTQHNLSAATKALETLGKHLGMFKDDDQSQDINALFVSGVRALIQSEPILPRDRGQLRLEDQNDENDKERS